MSGHLGLLGSKPYTAQPRNTKCLRFGRLSLYYIPTPSRQIKDHCFHFIANCLFHVYSLSMLKAPVLVQSNSLSIIIGHFYQYCMIYISNEGKIRQHWMLLCPQCPRTEEPAVHFFAECPSILYLWIY